jgi:4-hydroxy-3-methylbut-2-enyl diphosphate reductase
MDIQASLPYVIISFLYVQSMHIFNHLTGSKADRYNDPDRASFYRNNKILLSLLAFVAGAAGLITAYTIGQTALFTLLVMSALGLSYNLRLIPKRIRFLKYRRIRDIPSSKTLLIATAWGIVTALFPTLSEQGQMSPMALIVFLWSTGMVFVRTAFFDILDMQGVRIVGRNTIPIIVGEKRTRMLLKIILVVLFLLLPIASGLQLIGGFGYILMICPVFIFIVIHAQEKGDMLPGTTLEFFIESSFVLAGLLVLLGTLIWQ